MATVALGKKLPSFSVPTTGGWQNWQTITGQVDLPAGKHLLRLYVEKGPWNLNWLEFTATAKR